MILDCGLMVWYATLPNTGADGQMPSSGRNDMIDILTPQPTPEDIRQARHAAGLTQPVMAAIIGLTGRRAIQEWESGRDTANVALWELFLLKTGQHPTHELVAR